MLSRKTKALNNGNIRHKVLSPTRAREEGNWQFYDGLKSAGGGRRTASLKYSSNSIYETCWIPFTTPVGTAVPTCYYIFTVDTSTTHSDFGNALVSVHTDVSLPSVTSHQSFLTQRSRIVTPSGRSFGPGSDPPDLSRRLASYQDTSVTAARSQHTANHLFPHILIRCGMGHQSISLMVFFLVGLQYNIVCAEIILLSRVDTCSKQMKGQGWDWRGFLMCGPLLLKHTH